MGRKLPIYVEGLLDKKIIELTIDKIVEFNNYKNHQSEFFIVMSNGIGEVLKRMKKVDSTSIGIIDNDKKKPKQIDEYATCGKYGELEVLFKEENCHKKFLFVFQPGPETWIQESAKSLGETNEQIITDMKTMIDITKRRDNIIEIDPSS